MRPKLLRLTALGVLTMAGCGDSSPPTSPDDAAELPLEFRLHATAFEEFPDGWTVECMIDVIVSLETAGSPAPGRREYHGAMGGEAFRAILDQEGAGSRSGPTPIGPMGLRGSSALTAWSSRSAPRPVSPDSGMRSISLRDRKMRMAAGPVHGPATRWTSTAAMAATPTLSASPRDPGSSFPEPA